MSAKDKILEVLREKDMTTIEAWKKLPQFSLLTVKNVMKKMLRDGWIFHVGQQHNNGGARHVYSLEKKKVKKETLPERILRMLENGNHSSGEIARVLRLNDKRVSAALSRLKDQGRVFVLKERKIRGQKAFVYSIEDPLILPTEGSDTRVISGFGAVPRVKDKRTAQEKAFLCVAQLYDQILNEYVRQKTC